MSILPVQFFRFNNFCLPLGGGEAQEHQSHPGFAYGKENEILCKSHFILDLFRTPSEVYKVFET